LCPDLELAGVQPHGHFGGMDTGVPNVGHIPRE
jgi:hypothetical protein